MSGTLNVSRFLLTNDISGETSVGLSGQIAFRTNLRIENEVYKTTSYRDYLDSQKNEQRALELDALYPGQRNRVYLSQEEYLIQSRNIPPVE